MKISEMNWMQVEAYLKRDDRAVLPLGSTEQHAYLSLSVDSILAERVASEAAAPLGVPVFPVMAYGITPYFMAFPGSITLKLTTYAQVVREILDGLAAHGFRRILVVNGHGGNSPAAAVIDELARDNPAVRVKWTNWWAAPRAWTKVQEIDPLCSHASWMENFPWTRIDNATMPAAQKPMVDNAALKQVGPHAARAMLGDGNFGGFYQRPDEEMLAIWQTAVEETREMIETGWV